MQTAVGEQIGPECLSLGDERDAPDPDFPLVRNARFELSAAGDSIEFTSDSAVKLPAVSVILRVQCPGQLIYVRVVNVLLKTPNFAPPVSVRKSVPGTTITVKQGDTVYALARAQFPDNEAAVPKMAKAIVIANPRLFPDGRGRPLRIGEKLVMPDLRAVEQIRSSAAPPRSRIRSAPPAAAAPLAQPTRRMAQPGRPKTPQVSPPPPPRRLKSAAKLRLRLATGLDLRRSDGVDEARRAELRRMFVGDSVALAFAGVDTSAIELKVAQLREFQGGIDAQLILLENAVAALVRLVTELSTRAPRPPPPPPPPPRPVPPTEIVRYETPWWMWPALGAAALIVAIAGFLLGRKGRSQTAMAQHEARIDTLLKEARNAAGPLLVDTTRTARRPEPESVPAPKPRPRPKPAPAPMPEPAPALMPEPAPPAAPLFSPEEQPVAPPPKAKPERPALDFALTTPPQPASNVDLVLEITSAKPQEDVSINLRQQMAEALHSTRSMFSDVDRFIALGRIENALSLLQFQVEKDPKDRESWIKLLAVYRQQNMETEFERAHSEFKRLFPGEK
ncbi:MAG: type IV pilus assembly protein FimV [Burkholderiales bacterium]